MVMLTGGPEGANFYVFHNINNGNYYYYYYTLRLLLPWVGRLWFFCVSLVYSVGTVHLLSFSLQILLRIVPCFIVIRTLGDKRVTSKICLYRSYVLQLHNRYGLGYLFMMIFSISCL